MKHNLESSLQQHHATFSSRFRASSYEGYGVSAKLLLLLIIDNTASVGKKSYLIVTSSRPQRREMRKGGSGVCDKSHLEKAQVESYKPARSNDISRQCIMNSGA